MHAYPLLFLALQAYSQYTATYDPTSLPDKSESEQLGTNRCGTGSSQESVCQNVFVNAIDDFCLWGPPYGGPNSTIGETEPIVVSWCLKSGYGTRLIPGNTLRSAHFVQTPSYVQVTGLGDLTSLNIPAGDTGGELDPHGADGLGNPHGGLVFGNSFGAMRQYHEWTSFMAHDEFCIRACLDGPEAAVVCNHVYDVMGCRWNLPGNYDDGTFTSCDADAGEPMGVYGTSTWPSEQQHNGGPAPSAHPAPASSSCKTVSLVENAVVSGTTTLTASGSTATRTATGAGTGAGTGSGGRANGSPPRTSGLPSQTASAAERGKLELPMLLVSVVLGVMGLL
ncbi:hypothetical protein DACRYDRAFT_91118 [Dacryopinax primogenitus]|uniref:Macrofage activating glyco protein n=1 Tax=Dacryopinax primogenitus (strain DJM 731) TaxID=1858805 RepID=M5FSD5_DACPD|nr:uncharacterized protein DACRYDRAFT_91118 [Dacryopinax primogenitus]EJT98089.1 hypothetical protein DACRYDRAFT_91118 [Dacryopinax primogenitus]